MSRKINWARVTALWLASGRTPTTVAVYRCWAGRFDAHCKATGRDPIAHLTLERVRKIAKEYPRRRPGSRAGHLPLVATRALSCALAALGYRVPRWRPVAQRPRLLPLVRRYIRHRIRHRGIADRTRRFDTHWATTFLKFLAIRRRGVGMIRIIDLDAFFASCAKTRCAKTIAGICSSLRAFLRYLHMAGVIRADLATHVAAPHIRSVDRPPRTLPWSDVRRILRAIDTSTPVGRRDMALFLMMAAYGMGAAEVMGLRLEDIDWRSRRIRLRRPKTGVMTELPLLGPVARALAAYLRRDRPPHAPTRAIFVSRHMPHNGFTESSAIRHRLAGYASAAGVRDGYLGAHVFRHSHATRQIEQGTPAKVVGDILGHQRPQSTSVYVRGAVPRLRAMALPVPR